MVSAVACHCTGGGNMNDETNEKRKCLSRQGSEALLKLVTVILGCKTSFTSMSGSRDVMSRRSPHLHESGVGDRTLRLSRLCSLLG